MGQKEDRVLKDSPIKHWEQHNR